MRTAVVVLSGLVVFSGIVSVKFWSDLRAERRLTADLHAQLTEAKRLSESPIAAAPPPVITVAVVPESRSDSPPVKAPLPSQPAISLNQGLGRPLTSNERSAAEELLAETPFTVNETGQMMAKPSNIMTNNDLNKDGIITKEEATKSGRALIGIWNRYDLNKDDMVDEAEIAKASGL